MDPETTTTPVQSPGAESEAAESGSAESGSEPDPRDELIELDACELLGRKQLKRLQFPSAEPDRQPGTRHLRRCRWVEYNELVQVLVNTRHGIDGVERDPEVEDVTEVTIGGRTGSLATGLAGPGSCTIALAVTEESMVSVTGFVQEVVGQSAEGTELRPESTADACDLARRAAKLVEPKVPR